MSDAPRVDTRIVISVCPREAGTVVLPLERAGPRRRLDAPAIAKALRSVAAARGLSERVTVVEACAGGCHGRGPNVSLTIHLVPLPGGRADHVAVGWKAYLASLPGLPCVATIIDEHVSSRRPPALPQSGGAPAATGRGTRA